MQGMNYDSRYALTQSPYRKLCTLHYPLASFIPAFDSWLHHD